MNEPRCIAQLLRNESPGRLTSPSPTVKGVRESLSAPKTESVKKALTFLKSRRVWK